VVSSFSSSIPAQHRDISQLSTLSQSRHDILSQHKPSFSKGLPEPSLATPQAPSCQQGPLIHANDGTDVTHAPVSQRSQPDNHNSYPGPEAQLSALAGIFFSATSIYLSGVFDYDLCYWQSLNCAVPTLSEDEIQQHVESALTLSHYVLRTELSPLLLLFPLRVASARARRPGQRQQIMGSLRIIKSSFPVAEAFMTEIEELWSHGTMV